MNAIINYFKRIRLEMKKVSWLNRPQLVNSILVVFLFAFIVALFLFVADIGIGRLVELLYTIRE